MRRKTLIPAVIFLLLQLPIKAQTDLDRLIDGLQARYGKMRGLAADFTQVYVDRAGRRLREQGHLLIKRPGKMRWEYKAPEEKLFLTDGRKVYFYVPAEKQLTITPIRESDDPRTPFLFLLGRSNLRKDFARISKAVNETPVKPGNLVLELVPKKTSSSFKYGYAEVDPQTAQVHRIALINASGGRSDFLLTNLKENYLAEDAEFVLNPPPGVRVLN